MTKGLRKENLLVLIISLDWKNMFTTTHQESKKLMFELAQTSHFGLWDITLPEPQLAIHIYYVKYEDTLTCKRISWDSGGRKFLKQIYFLYVQYKKVTILAHK